MARPPPSREAGHLPLATNARPTGMVPNPPNTPFEFGMHIKSLAVGFGEERPCAGVGLVVSSARGDFVEQK